MFNSCLLKAEEKKVGPPPAAAAAGGPQAKGGKEGSAYIAPALRDGGNRKGETMAMGRRSKIHFLHSSLFYSGNIRKHTLKQYLITLFFPVNS